MTTEKGGMCSNSKYEESKPCASIDCKEDKECLEYKDPFHPYGYNCLGSKRIFKKIKIKFIFL